MYLKVHAHTSLTLVNLAHISSASLIRPALSRYLAHLELMKRSAVSRAWASSIQRAASRIFPACWVRKFKRDPMKQGYDNQTTEPFNYPHCSVVAIVALISMLQFEWIHKLVIVLYLEYLGFNEEELYQSRCALNGSVDVFESHGVLADLIIVLSQEILHPE